MLRRNYITIESVETKANGAKIVRGTTPQPLLGHPLFTALRRSLHLLGGPEMRREMERIVKEMA